MMMSKSVHTDERQMDLDFDANPVRSENFVSNHFNVVCLNAFIQSRHQPVEPTPTLERLLQEAQKIKW
jgi:hypothetical protein